MYNRATHLCFLEHGFKKSSTRHKIGNKMNAKIMDPILYTKYLLENPITSKFEFIAVFPFGFMLVKIFCQNS